MTGKEILEEAFERSGMRGYKAEEVDAFLQKVAAYVDEQEVEKNNLTYKMKILADKIEEYRADENSIRDALLGAQKLGASIVAEAKEKAEKIINEAQESADSTIELARSKAEGMIKESLQKTTAELNELKKECDKERMTLERTKKEVSNFKALILKQYKVHLDLLTNLPSFEEENEAKAEEILENNDEVTADTEISEEISAQSVVDTVDILKNDEELQNQENEQTKEFSSDSSITSADDGAPVNIGSTAPRKNYMEKFGELKFGEFDQKDR